MGAALAALLTAAAAAAPADDAAARLRAAEDAVASAEAGVCPPAVTAESAVADAAAGRLPKDAADAVDAAREDLRLYFACRAYAAGGAAPCAALSETPARVSYSVDKSALERPGTMDFLCASDLHDMRMARAAIAGDRAAFAAACRAHDELGHRDFKRGKVEEGCALLSGGAADPEGACARAEPLFSSPAPRDFCRGELGQFSGDPAACAAISGQPASRELCDGYAAWRRARGGDRAACAASPVCRVLDGAGPQACAPLAARALAPVCAAHYRAASLDAAAADLEAAERALSARAGEPAPGRGDAARLDAGLEACARLRVRLERLRRPPEAGSGRPS